MQASKIDLTSLYSCHEHGHDYVLGPCPGCQQKAGAPIALVANGVKHDQGKPDMSLLSHIGLVKIAEVMTFGSKKYSRDNWRGGFAWSRPLAAAARHLYAYIGGEDKDPETGLSHLAHCACCLLFVLEFEETHKELDDRYKGNSNANSKK